MQQCQQLGKKGFVSFDYRCKCYETFFFVTDDATSNWRLACKDLQGTNTQAFYAAMSAIKKKKVL